MVHALKIDKNDTRGELSKIALNALRNVLSLCKMNEVDPRSEQILIDFEKFGGLEMLEALQQHPDHTIYMSTQEILL